MKKVSYFPFIFLLCFLFFLLSFSKTPSQKIRGACVSGIAPFWNFFNFFVATADFNSPKAANVLKQKNLELENQLLKSQTEGVYEWLMFDQRIDEQVERLKEVKTKSCNELYWRDFFIRRSDELRQLLETELQTLPAKVIFREPSSWSSSIWINVGEKDNEHLGRLIIGKNSPVVLGDSLIGVVEYIGKKESRVRLITDSGLIPSVRAVRGNSQDRMLMQLASSFLDRAYNRNDLFEDTSQRELFFSLLSKMMKNFAEKKNIDYFLAKGELHGASSPLWKSYGAKLKGIGFNYDYPDSEGPARDLKTGKVLEDKYNFLSRSLIEKGDLLVTTGMDGVFPAGLKVAVVSKVKELEEGAYFYGIEAEPTALGIEDLSFVFVMPPLNQ